MNKLVLISGSSRGLGAAMAKSFSEAGYKVAINYFNSEKEAKDLSETLSNQSHAFKCDVSNKNEVDIMLENIKEVFGHHAYNININSTKSMTGHLLGAAGAIEAISCVLSIKNGIVPPTINHFNDDPEIDNKLNFTFNKAQKRKVSVAMRNTFGFGGHNACVLIKEFVD